MSTGLSKQQKTKKELILEVKLFQKRAKVFKKSGLTRIYEAVDRNFKSTTYTSFASQDHSISSFI